MTFDLAMRNAGRRKARPGVGAAAERFTQLSLTDRQLNQQGAEMLESQVSYQDIPTKMIPMVSLPKTMAEPTGVSYPMRITEAEIKLTPAAQRQMRELLAGNDEGFEAIRVFVTGGGCGGMTYGMTYAEEPKRYDSVLEGEGFKIVVDPVALNYLQGCEIDYVRQGLNTHFVFNKVFTSLGGSGTCGGCGGGGF
jgi:iron-sulfur cluster insertion protein